jgi:cytochrome c
MNSFEINKYLGALLGTCLILLAVHILSGAVFTSPAPAKPGYEVAVKEEKAGPGEAAKPAEVPIDTMLASASVEHGAQVAKQCGACHNFQEGQGPKVGPDLYGVVGRKVASKPGFNYSAALKAHGGDTWTFEELNKWLKDPRADVPGTAMTFAGLTSEKQRADVIAYLNSLSKTPLPLPTGPKEGEADKADKK